jgi:uncharacterized delta-60 repeat protein
MVPTMTGAGNRAGLAAVAALLAALLPGAPAAAAPHPGQLDPTFGKAGKATVAFSAEAAGKTGVKYELPFQYSPGHLQMALAPEGKVVVASSSKIVRLLPNGKPDQTFGTGGAVAIEPPPGRVFVLADVAVDSRGRVLVAGSTRPLPTESTLDPLAGLAMVRRYAASGSIDTSFAQGGTLDSDLGFEAPKIGSQRYPSASVGLHGLVVDAEDRPVLSGGAVTEVISCYSGDPPNRAVSTGFVARLSEAGGLDPSFGDAGLRQVGDLGSFAQGHILPGGSVLALGSAKFSCNGATTAPLVLASLTAASGPDQGFGFAGFRSLGLRAAPTVAIAPSGKIALLAPPRKRKRKAHQLLMRLLPSGATDPGFGRTGRVQIVGSRSGSFAALAVDGAERILLAGHASRPVPRGGARRSSFLLGRIKPKGTFDRSFGRRGTVRTGFGGPASAYATQVLLGAKGRVLVGGIVSDPRLPPGGGFAIARYFGGG